MINLLSPTDGFRIAMGPWIINLAALITMLTDCWPPEYPNDAEREREAKYVFSILVFMHVVMATVKAWSLYYGPYFIDKQIWLMLCVICI